jgi:hypothetical protein
VAVVNVNSTQLTNFYSTPFIRSNSYLTGSGDWVATDVCAMGATDSNNSTYRFCQIPSNALILNIAVMNDANTAGTSYKCGVLLQNGGGVVVAGSDAIFIPAGTTMASARNVWTNLFFPAVAGSGAAVANVSKRVWELLGLATDPSLVYEVSVTAVTAGTAGGNLALQVNWTK